MDEQSNFTRGKEGVNRRVTTHESLVHGLVWIDSTDTNEIRVTERAGGCLFYNVNVRVGKQCGIYHRIESCPVLGMWWWVFWIGHSEDIRTFGEIFELFVTSHRVID